MTREQQIREAADRIAGSSDHPFLAIEDAAKKEGFVLGVRWADSHPCWHKYPEEKPSLKQRILIYATKGRIIETVYNYPMLVSGEPYGEPTFEDTRYTAINVIAWMEKPQPPKFDLT